MNSRPRRIPRGSNGWHWLLKDERGLHVLRRYNPWRAPASIPFEHAFLKHLAARGWPLAVPLENLNGATLFAKDDEAYAIFPFLPGRPLHETSVAAYERGVLLARYHVDARSFPDREQRPSWTTVARGAERAWPPSGLVMGEVLRQLAPVAPDIVNRVRVHAAYLAESFVDVPHVPPVVVHGDWSRWNLLFATRELTGVLDFDFCHWDSPFADLAMAVRLLGDPSFTDPLLAGYESIEPLTRENRARIPIYSMALALGHITHGLSFGLAGHPDLLTDAFRALDLLDVERRTHSG